MVLTVHKMMHMNWHIKIGAGKAALFQVAKKGRERYTVCSMQPKCVSLAYTKRTAESKTG